MTGTLVVDASFVMVLLSNDGDATTTWANDVIRRRPMRIHPPSIVVTAATVVITTRPWHP
ncbi:MAG TPA: hypothetical protein VES40_01575 [Ilumatobacteraceae bacterium]|nr:hypothetical protein [Ilumatobacteraceae bacterium]